MNELQEPLWIQAVRRNDTRSRSLLPGYRDIESSDSIFGRQEQGQALTLACTLRSEKMVAHLLKDGAGEHAEDGLFNAALGSTPNIVRLLLKHRIPLPSHKDILDKLIFMPEMPECARLVDILLGVLKNSGVLSEGLLQAGLCHVALAGRGDLPAIFVKHGALTNLPGPDGTSPLELAVFHSNHGMVLDELLKQTPDDALPSLTPLLLKTLSRYSPDRTFLLANFAKLLDGGVPPTDSDRVHIGRETELIAAVKMELWWAMERLLDAGANPLLRDADRRRAVQHLPAFLYPNEMVDAEKILTAATSRWRERKRLDKTMLESASKGGRKSTPRARM